MAEEMQEGKGKATEGLECLRCYRRSGERWSSKAWSSLSRCQKMQLLLQLRYHLTLEFALAQRGSVASDDDKLGLAGTEHLQGRLVAQGHYRVERH